MPLSYTGEPGIRQFLDTMAERFGWDRKFEGENVIGLVREGHSLTLEPAGQIELSGSAFSTIEQVVTEHQKYTKEITSVGDDLGISYCSAGIHPQWRREDMHWMPKGRYKIMREYLPTKGDLAIDMMTRTCGTQINLDFESEADMVRKMRVSIGLQPFLTALFANSWQIEGKDTGYASYRSHIWKDTDPDRCGILPFVFEEAMSFERYVDYVLDVPMFFIVRNGEMINMAGKSFRAFINGDLPESRVHTPTMQDWFDHMSTAFPEVRLKTFIELRGTDSVPPPLVYAIASFWVGLLYDEQALKQASDFIADWSIDDHRSFRNTVAKDGLNTKVPRSSFMIRDIAPEILDIAAQGLSQQAEQNYGLVYLDDLRERLQMPGKQSLCQ